MSNPTPKSQTNTLWVIAAVGLGVFFLWRAPDAKPVGPSGSVEATTRSVFVSQAKGNEVAFNQAADRVAAGEIRTDRQLLDYLKPLTQAARLEANKPFDAMFEQNIPDGEFGEKASDVAEFLRKVAKSWK